MAQASGGQWGSEGNGLLSFPLPSIEGGPCSRTAQTQEEGVGTGASGPSPWGLRVGVV